MKLRGKTYISLLGDKTIVLCTKCYKNKDSFSGVVVESNDESFPVGYFSNGWSAHEKVFVEYNDTIILN